MSYATKHQIYWGESPIQKEFSKCFSGALMTELISFGTKSQSWISELKIMVYTIFTDTLFSLLEMTKRTSRKHSSKDLQTDFQYAHKTEQYLRHSGTQTSQAS